jgi:hypothetical protein
MSEPIVPQERVWERGWDGHLAAQLRRMARLPLAEKLQWLEDAQRLAEYIQNHRTDSTGAEPAARASLHTTATRT